MANNLTDYLEDKILNLFRATNITAPATVYAALFTAAPGEAGGGTEVSGGSYARTAITYAAPSSGSISNSLVTFPTATGSWGTITDMAIMDASTSGNMLAYATLTTSKVVGNGDTFSFPAASIPLTVS